MPRILIADDQAHVLEALEMLLRPCGFSVECCRSPQTALEAMSAHAFDLLLMDLNYARDTTSGEEGLDMIAAVRALDGLLPIIVMTGWGSVENAVESIKRGANDFVQKPWDNERLLSLLRTHVELHAAQRKAQRLELVNALLCAPKRPLFIAEAASMQPVLERIAQVGPSDANVLITGENGCGKEVVAKLLHASSPRSAQTLIAVNTGGLPEGTFESELFGHVKGAFTDARADRIGRFEMADGGCIFLDEIANVPLRQQVKLLRVLESGEMERVGSSRTRRIDARVLSATNADIRTMVAKGDFRADLLFRLNTVEIHVPPLRERRDDIPLLAAHFLTQLRQRYKKDVEGFAPSAMQALQQYAWPGNVRELEHTVERALLLARGAMIETANLALADPRALVAAPSLEDMSLEEVEAMLVRKALARFGGNISQSAESLGLSRAALYRRMERYGL